MAVTNARRTSGGPHVRAWERDLERPKPGVSDLVLGSGTCGPGRRRGGGQQSRGLAALTLSRGEPAVGWLTARTSVEPCCRDAGAAWTRRTNGGLAFAATACRRALRRLAGFTVRGRANFSPLKALQGRCDRIPSGYAFPTFEALGTDAFESQALVCSPFSRQRCFVLLRLGCARGRRRLGRVSRADASGSAVYDFESDNVDGELLSRRR